jgi:outer membrane protein assembly factor BamD
MKFRATIAGVALLALTTSGCLFRHKNTNPLANVQSAQPDKVLFDRSMNDMDHGRYTVARLTLQALINAYPDSEYLARAKMAIADSWYREGGSDGLAQAEAEYKDFITFFPTMKEASEAQLKIADIHYRQIEKPDRDPTHALRAQTELETFLAQYPDSPLADQARQQLRNVEEVLAERQFRIGLFYYRQGAYRAAQSRLQEIVDKYPLYSRGDEAVSLLAHSYLTTSQRYTEAVPDVSGRMKELMRQNAIDDRAQAEHYLKYLIERYPLSTADVHWAARQLQAMKLPVPRPTPQAIAFQREEMAGRTDPGKFGRVLDMLRSRPIGELDRAAKIGNPPVTDQNQPEYAMNPPSTRPSTSPNASISFGNVGDNGFSDDPPAGATTSGTVTGGNAPASASAGGGAPTAATNADDIQTPDELDKEEQDRILAAEVHRNVPVHLTKKQIAKLKKQSRKAAKKGLPSLLH